MQKVEKFDGTHKRCNICTEKSKSYKERNKDSVIERERVYREQTETRSMRESTR